MTSPKTSLFRKIFSTLKSIFVSGLIALLPLALTVTLFAFLFRTAKSWLNPLYRLLPIDIQVVPLSEFIVALIGILLMGTILKLFLLRQIVEMVEHFFRQLPLIRQIYFGIKQLINAFGPKDVQHFQQVILVEFPRKGTYSIGFLTNEIPCPLPSLEKKEETDEYHTVFVPHTPNPTSGFFILVPTRECISTDLSRQEAMTMIISGGIIQPQRWNTRP